MTTVDGTSLMTLFEAAERLRVDEKTVRRYIAAGRLTGYRLGDHLIRVDAGEVDALLRPITTMRTTSSTTTRGLRETNAEVIARLGLRPGVMTPLPPSSPEQRVEALRWAADLIEANGHL